MASGPFATPFTVDELSHVHQNYTMTSQNQSVNPDHKPNSGKEVPQLKIQLK